jgi:hypothetical protein
MKQLLSTFVMVIEFLLSQECRIWLRLALKPLAVLATLALFLWVGAWFDTQIANHIAHAEAVVSSDASAIQALACAPGTTQVGDRCYPPCQPGDTPIANEPLCAKPCPAFTLFGFGHKPISDKQCEFQPTEFFIGKYSPNVTSINGCLLTEEKQNNLCYPRCAASHYGEGPICWQRCPIGYADHGATCFRHIFDFFGKNSYGRGVGINPRSCSGHEGLHGVCYERCQTGFGYLGPANGCVQRVCPKGYTPVRFSCKSEIPLLNRETYSRGAGVPLNSIPVANDATVSTPLNTAVTFPTLALDADALDIANLQFSLGNFSNGSHTIVNGNNVYTPNPGFEGVDTMRWTVFDGKHRSNIATITMLVGTVGPNNAPVALDRTVAVTEDTSITITVTCTDAENDDLFYQLIAKPQHGDYEWLPPNTVIYTPTVDFVGTDSFTFQSHDGREASNISTITLTVAAINDAPVVEAQSITTTRNHNTAINLFATDVESDTLTFSLVTSPTYGTVSGEIPNLLYTPHLHFVGADSFQFQATDAHGAASVATIQITVQPTNTAPLAESLVLTTAQESTLGVNLFASDADGDALAYSLVTRPTQGTVSGEGAELLYTPNAGFIGTDSFTFQANDGQADSPMTTVTIHVTPAPAVASVVGLIYEDRNGNAQPDGEDVGAPSLLVTLTPASARAGDLFSTITEAGGGWRIDNVPFGSYTVRVTGGNGVQIEQPVEATLTVGQRGLQQLPPGAVKVTGRALFLPLVQR